MVAILLSLAGLFIPITHAQTHAVITPTVYVERSERTRATATFPVTPAASVSAPVVAPKTTTTKPAAKPAAQTSVPAAPAPAATFAQEVEKEIHRLVNAERTKQGLSTLKSDIRLASIARAHSQDMLTNDYFSHTDLSGCGSSCRMSNAGYAWSAAGENIYTMTGYSMGPAAAARHMVDGWMDSPGHRANILNGTFTNHGIGVATSGSTVYATSVFALPQ